MSTWLYRRCLDVADWLEQQHPHLAVVRAEHSLERAAGREAVIRVHVIAGSSLNSHAVGELVARKLRWKLGDEGEPA